MKFVEKHLAGRRETGTADRLASGALALGLRAGILGRAALAAAGRLAREIAAPAVEVALAWLALAAVAFARSAGTGFAFDAVYYTAVLPMYAAVIVAFVGLAGGYRGRRPARTVLIGAGFGFLVLSTASLFVPALSFSRATLLLGAVAAALALLAQRAGRGPDTRDRRAIVVGDAAEAERLRRLTATAPPVVSGRQAPPRLDVIGHVSDDGARRASASTAPLGPRRQLRDLARLHAADEVVFASESLTNTAILEGMRALRDTPVALKILASGHDRIIGKASIEDFSGPLLDAERTVAPLRPRRRFDVTVALAVLALRPLLRLAARIRPARFGAAAALADRMPQVIAGRRALVGYHPDATHPPPAWGLQPAVVSVLDTLPATPGSIAEAHRAYWYYARHQSAGLDLEVLARAAMRGRD